MKENAKAAKQLHFNDVKVLVEFLAGTNTP
jgi:hypothetical protein